jgi:hypothetical protein
MLELHILSVVVLAWVVHLAVYLHTKQVYSTIFMCLYVIGNEAH